MSGQIRLEQTPRPNLFIVGAPKCGTTSLHVYLSQHPDFFMSHLKELAFFCPDIETRPESATESMYLDHFREGAGRRWLGESTPLYLTSKESAARIAAFNPSARIIMVLREPVAMMQALYGQYLHMCIPCRADFERELRAQEESRRRGERYAFPGHWGIQRFLDVADYAAQIRRFRDHFPESQIKVILYDDLARDTPGVYADLVGWLGLTPTGSESFSRLNSQRVHLDPRVSSAIRSFTSITRILRRAFPGTTECIREFVIRKGTRTLSRLDPDQHARLQAEFFPDFSELESLIGRSLAQWRMDGAVERPSGSSNLTRSSTGPDAPADALRRQAMPSRVPVRTPRPSVPQPSS